MSNNITHLFFAADAFKKTADDCNDFIAKHQKSYRLGALGYDFLYMLRQFNLKGNRLANRLHRECIYEVFEKFVLADNSDVFAYGLGMITHYILDKHTHAMVAHQTETALPKYFASAYQNNIHNLVETEADEWVLVKNGANPRNFDAYAYCKAPKELKHVIGAFYQKKIYPLLSEPNVTAKRTAFCFTTWNFLSKIWRDSNGRKKRIIEWLEKNSENRNFSSLLRPTNNPNNADLLNMKNAPFRAVRNCEETITDSFPELYEKATREAVQYIHAMFAARDGQAPLKREDFIVNYDGIKM